MAKLIGLMVLLYGIQAACSNPGLAYLPLVAYLTDTKGFSATQLASFQTVVVLPWFSKPLWGLIADGVPPVGLSPQKLSMALLRWDHPGFCGPRGLGRTVGNRLGGDHFADFDGGGLF
ncbi:MAG: hypothetical protein O3A14_20340 [Cyanobacteria bacterium]|nr:hypothetical protein [Cyanobacteriota bacterium]